ncbi:MAG: hypothetical protein NTV34_01725, partial [Proteobacteria bacterium]|nr:hypothetical protein [Pseudomonadota bacterium]
MAVCSKRRQLFALLSLFLQSLVSASCRSRIDSSDLSNVSPTLLDQGLVKVSSTFYSDDGREHLKLSGYGFLVKVPAKANSNPIYFVVTASHLSQGGMNEFSGGDESRIDLSIEARFQGRVVKLEPINRVAALRRDIEVIHVKPVPGLEALATLTQDSGISPIIRANHPYGWLKVTHPNAIESLNGPMMNQNGLYPLSLLSAVPQSDFVRKIDRNPLSALRKSELEQIISASSDPWRVQMLKLGYELVLDEVETYRRLPAGFSGAPMISRVDQQWILFGMVTTYSRVFDLSWCLPSHFISRTINLYMQNILSSPPSKAAVLTNSEQWKLKQGLLYRQSRYEPDELGGAAYSEVSYTKTPSGNGSSSPGGNGSSSPGGNGSSSPGGNGSSSPGGNGSSSPGGDGTTALDVDVLSRLGLMYGLSFAAPKINGKT